MDKKLLFIIILLFSIKTIAQDNYKALYGKVYDELGVLSSAHIINTNTKKATYSNDSGEFKIFIKIGDSLKITSVGYKTLRFKITENHFGITENSYKMIKEIIELDEIEVKKHNLTGSLSSDIKQVKNKKLINASSLKLPNANKRKLTLAERKLYTARSNTLSFIINTISGRIKILKKEKRNEDEEKELKYLKTNFKHYIKNDLKIDSLKVDLFILYLKTDIEYKKNKQNEFDLIKFIKLKSLEFKKTNP